MRCLLRWRPAAAGARSWRERPRSRRSRNTRAGTVLRNVQTWRAHRSRGAHPPCACTAGPTPRSAAAPAGARMDRERQTPAQVAESCGEPVPPQQEEAMLQSASASWAPSPPLARASLAPPRRPRHQHPPRRAAAPPWGFFLKKQPTQNANANVRRGTEVDDASTSTRVRRVQQFEKWRP